MARLPNIDQSHRSARTRSCNLQHISMLRVYASTCARNAHNAPSRFLWLYFKKKIKLKILYPQAPAFSQLANVIVANNENRCAYTTLIPDVENSVITLWAFFPQPYSTNGAGALAVMGVLSPGLIFSGWDSVGAKLIETTEAEGCEFGGAWEGKGKGDCRGCCCLDE